MARSKRPFSSEAALGARIVPSWDDVRVSVDPLKVPYTWWEALSLTLWGGLLVLLAGIEFSRHKPAAGVLALVLLIGAGVWSWHAHRAQPEFFAERRPAIPQAIAATVLVAAGVAVVVLDSSPGYEAFGALFALAVIATVVNERTRELPDESDLEGREELVGRARSLSIAAGFVTALIFAWFG